MNEIGGYFELELRGGSHYHPEALRLNTARNCFEYVLLARGYKKVYIPYYTCEVMLQPLKRHGISFAFYSVNVDLEPVEPVVLQSDEAFLYTNYFGLKQRCVERLAAIYGEQLIVDNAQAFYAPRLKGIDTFYSARKFFGVPDGAYLYTDKQLSVELEQDVSYRRCAHLLRRIDESASQGYMDFRSNDDSLDNQPIKRMSKLTERLLLSIDYETIRQVRRENFRYLDGRLGRTNKCHWQLDAESVPMVYPYYGEDEKLKSKLIDNKIFVATYWPNVYEWCQGRDVSDFGLADRIIALPLDQRYDKENLHRVCKNILGYE